jgi:hypothetical protein
MAALFILTPGTCGMNWILPVFLVGRFFGVGSVLASSRHGPLLRSKSLELFVPALEKTPGNDLAGNNGTSTLCEAFGTNWPLSATSSALFRSSSMPALREEPSRLLVFPDSEQVVCAELCGTSSSRAWSSATFKSNPRVGRGCFPEA